MNKIKENRTKNPRNSLWLNNENRVYNLFLKSCPSGLIRAFDAVFTVLVMVSLRVKEGCLLDMSGIGISIELELLYKRYLEFAYLFIKRIHHYLNNIIKKNYF